jgi:hypothetical protein
VFVAVCGASTAWDVDTLGNWSVFAVILAFAGINLAQTGYDWSSMLMWSVRMIAVYHFSGVSLGIFDLVIPLMITFTTTFLYKLTVLR